MEFVCHLSEGYILVKKPLNMLMRVKTDSTEMESKSALSNILCQLLGVSVTSEAGTDIKKDPYKYLNCINAVFDSAGSDIVAYRGILKIPVKGVVICEFNDWLCIHMVSDDRDFCADIATRKFDADGSYLLIHKSNPVLGIIGMLEKGVSGSVPHHIFNICISEKDVVLIKDIDKCAIDGDRNGVSSFGYAIADIKYHYILERNYSESVALLVSGVSYLSSSLGLALAQSFGITKECFDRVIDAINNRLVDIVTRDISLYHNMDFVSDTCLLTFMHPALEYIRVVQSSSHYSLLPLYKSCCIKDEGNYFVLDLLKLCGHKHLCDIINETIRVNNLHTFSTNSYLIYNGYKKFLSYVGSDWETRLARIAVVMPEFQSWYDKLTYENVALIAALPNKLCSSLMNFLFVLRDNRTYYRCHFYGTGFDCELYPFLYFPDSLLVNEEIKALLDDNRVEFIEFAAHLLMHEILNNDDLNGKSFDFSEDLWDIDYTVSKSETCVLVTTYERS